MEQLVSLLTTYGYFILFPLAVIEGPIITVLAAFLASLGYLNIFIVYAVAVFGDLAGDILFYAIGRWGGRQFLGRWGKYLGVSPEYVLDLEKHFENQGGRIILFGKWTQAVGFAILVVAGTAKMPFKKFIQLNLLGSLPKLLAFVAIGYYFGQAYRQIDKYFGYATLSMLFAIILVVAIYFFRKKFKSKIT